MSAPVFWLFERVFLSILPSLALLRPRRGIDKLLAPPLGLDESIGGSCIGILEEIGLALVFLFKDSGLQCQIGTILGQELPVGKGFLEGCGRGAIHPKQKNQNSAQAEEDQKQKTFCLLFIGSSFPVSGAGLSAKLTGGECPWWSRNSLRHGFAVAPPSERET